MKHELIERQNSFRAKMVCDVIYKIFYYLGNKFYIVSEKCVYFSKDRDRKILIDKEYEERQNVGKMVLDNEKLKEEFLGLDNFKIECDEVVKELGSQHVSNKNELANCYEIVYALWLAHIKNDTESMDNIFKNVGLDKDNFKGEDDVNFG